MTFLAVQSKAPLRLVPPLLRRFGRSTTYFPAEGLREAMDAAMLIGIPLLLTGEPGAGKTTAAKWLRDQLGGRMLSFDVKSTTSGRDLLYSFDEVARFRDRDEGRPAPLVNYLTFNALGEAIIRGLGGAGRLTPIKDDAGTAARAFGVDSPDAMVAASLLPHDKAFADAEPEHCVVLLDEMDKAPRDTPNDLLGELDLMTFRIPELGLEVGNSEPVAEGTPLPLRPIVVITSNSEKGLPEPFLRRCAFFDIPPPDRDKLAQIVGASFPAVTTDSAIFKNAHAFYTKLRTADWLRKKPGTAELLAWIGCLVTDAEGYERTIFDRVRARAGLVCLLKSKDDLDEGRKLFDSWAT